MHVGGFLVDRRQRFRRKIIDLDHFRHRIVRRRELLEFAGPPLVRSGDVAPDDLDRLVTGLGVDPARVVDSAWVDNGPGWVALLLEDAQDVLDSMLGIGVKSVRSCGPKLDPELRDRLFVERERRPKPARDDKAVASWNGNCASSPTVRVTGRDTEPEMVKEPVGTLGPTGSAADPRTGALPRSRHRNRSVLRSAQQRNRRS